MDVNKSNNSLWKAGTGAFAILSAILGYLLFEAKGISKDQNLIIDQRVAEISSARMSLDSIGMQMDAKIAEIKSLGGRVEELEAAKKQLEADVAGLKSAGELSKQQYDGKIAEYISLLNNKDAELNRLRKENGILAEKNRTLTSENTDLSTENVSLKGIKKSLSDSVENVSRKNSELSAKVSRASALQAQEVQVLAISDRGKERDGGTYRASKVSKIKVAFSLMPNPIAKQDEKAIYLRVLDPDGAVLFDTAAGSGSFNIFGKETNLQLKSQSSFKTITKTLKFPINVAEILRIVLATIR
jgi:uncharacterized protein (UPF0335 family)